jgi:hypothetical protein
MNNPFQKKAFSQKEAILAGLFISLLLQGQSLLWAAPFADVYNNHWANRYIDFLSGRQVVTGYPDQTFRPNQPVTRAEFAVMLAKSQNMITGRSMISPFADVPSSHWAAGAIQSVANQGWIAGYPGNRFLPNQPISQAEMYTIVAKASGQSLVNSTEAEQILGHFQDASMVPAWARISVATATNKGIYVNELSNSILSPNVDATRASVATTIAKLINQSFRQPVDVAQAPTGEPVDVKGTLQATARVGEWIVVTDHGKQYFLTNPGSLAQQPWFTVGSRVHLQGRIDPQASTTQHQVVKINSLASAQVTENLVNVTGTVRPSTQTPGAWVVVTSNNKVYRILNPEDFDDLSLLQYGSHVKVSGNLRPDVVMPQGEGTAIVATKITSAQVQKELTLTGTLRPTTEAGGWTITVPDTNKKYVLLGVDTAKSEDWFRSGAKVEVKGAVRNDIPTIYMEGPVFLVSEIEPNPDELTGNQEVKLYFPNLISMVRNPGSLIDEPVIRVLQGPNLPRKAVEALLDGPMGIEQLRGYFQDEETRQLSLHQMNISNGIATVVLKSPSGFKFKNDIVPDRLSEGVKLTLTQFPGIEEVKVGIVSTTSGE